MVRRANLLQREIKKQKAEIEKSKRRVKSLRAKISREQVRRSTAQRQVIDNKQRIRKIDQELKTLK